ncbi:MAG: FtsQ-type POTRA domain-containing protein [Acidobacteriota bacterium]
MSTVAAPADRRFRRAHVKPSRKGVKWAGAARVASVSAVAALAAAYGVHRVSAAIVHARVLAVDRIVVKGNERMSRGQVLAVVGGLRGESLIAADLEHWRQELLKSSWVRDAALRRSLPSTVEVVVTERQPVGVARVNDAMYLVDERGTMIDEYGPQYADFDLPVIDGLTLSGTPESAVADQARAELAARVIGALRARPEIARQLSQVDVRDPHNATVLLANDPAVVALGEDQFVERLQNYLELAAGLRATVPDIDRVDARFDNRMFVRPVAKAEKPGARTAEPAAARPNAGRKHR